MPGQERGHLKLRVHVYESIFRSSFLRIFFTPSFLKFRTQKMNVNHVLPLLNSFLMIMTRTVFPSVYVIDGVKGTRKTRFKRSTSGLNDKLKTVLLEKEKKMVLNERSQVVRFDVIETQTPVINTLSSGWKKRAQALCVPTVSGVGTRDPALFPPIPGTLSNTNIHRETFSLSGTTDRIYRWPPKAESRPRLQCFSLKTLILFNSTRLS